MDSLDPYFQSDGYRIASFITNLNAVQPSYGNLVHLLRDCMIAIASKPIGLRSYDKVRAQIMGQTVEFVDVALAIADVDAATGFAEEVN